VAIVIAFFLVLGAFIPWTLLQLSGESGPGAMGVYGWILAGYGAARLSYLAVTGEKRILSLTFWLFVYVWMGLAPMLQLATGDLPLLGVYNHAEAFHAFGIVALGLAAFEFGAITARGRADFGFAALRRNVLDRRVLPGRNIAAGVVATMSVMVLVSYLGGWESLVVSRGDLIVRTLELVGSEGLSNFLIFTSFLRVPICVVYFLSLYLWKHRATLLTGRLRAMSLPMLVVFAAVNLFVNNPLNSPRYWIGTIVLGTLFVVLPDRPRYSLALWAFVLLAALILVFPHADLFRNRVDPEAVGDIGLTVNLQTMDFDAFQQLMNAGLYVSANGVSFGRQLLGALGFWMPRSVWTTKPLPSGQLVAMESGYQFTNLSMPLWGEAYLDGSYVAVVFMFAAYGFFLSKTERHYLRSAEMLGTAGAVGVPIVAAYQLFLLRGALISGVAYLVPIIAMLALCTRRISRASVLRSAPQA
jgi:hypothetical protein